MGLYISFRTREVPNNILNRFESAIKLFTTLNKKFIFSNSEIIVFDYEPLEDLNPNMEYIKFDFGTLNTYILKKIKGDNYDKQIIKGLEIRGILEINKRKFNYSFVLNPFAISKQYYDIRFDILPNDYAENLIDLEKYLPSFRDILLDRFKEYNELVENKHNYYIRLAVIAEHGNEIDNIKDWFMVYSKETDLVIHKILNNSLELKNVLEFTNEKKFVNELMNNDNFVLCFDKYAQDNNVAIVNGSIFIKPSSNEDMRKFIDNISKDIINISSKWRD